MTKSKIHFSIYCGLFLAIINMFTSQCLATEPKSLRELRTKIENVVFTYNAPREFVITRDDSLFLDKKLSISGYGIQQCFLGFNQPQPCNQYHTEITNKEQTISLWIYIVPFKSFTNCLIHGNERVVWSPFNMRSTIATATYPPPSHGESSRPFFDSFWNTEPIGIFSSEYRLGDMEKHATYSVIFYRGNIKGYVFSTPIDTREAFKGNKINYDLMYQIFETPINPDPREIAWRIDQYLKGDPLEQFNNEEKQKLKTLEITLPKDIEFEQGKEYPLHV